MARLQTWWWWPCPPRRLPTRSAAVTGIAGKITVDATNAIGERDPSFPSLAAQVKSIIGGPTAKAFNINFANIYDRIDAQAAPPGNLFAADDDARATAEQLSRDAGFDPIYVGDLDQARAVEDSLGLMFAINQAGMGPFFYRMTPPDRL